MKRMKVEELMLFDWVYNKEEGQNERVTEMWEDGFVVTFTNRVYEIENFEPIHLTEEIMKKNFPTPKDIRWCQEGNSDTFCVAWEEPIGLGYNISLCVSYVHELQHILKICGIKKDILLD